MKIHRHQRPAAVLLLALLIMAGITASTIGIALLITSDFEQSRSTEQYIIASLAADSGVERGLDVIRLGRAHESLEDTMTASSRSGVNTLQINGTQATSDVAAGASTDTPSFVVPAGQTITVDLLPVPPEVAIPTVLRLTTNQSLEVSWTTISGAGSVGQGFFPVSAGTDIDVTLNNVYTEGGSLPGPFAGTNVLGYRAQIKNPSTIATNVATVAVQQVTGATVQPVYSLISLISTGAAKDATAEKVVTTLWQRPSSGVFSYVLFTEGDIIPTN